MPALAQLHWALTGGGATCLKAGSAAQPNQLHTPFGNAFSTQIKQTPTYNLLLSGSNRNTVFLVPMKR